VLAAALLTMTVLREVPSGAC